MAPPSAFPAVPASPQTAKVLSSLHTKSLAEESRLPWPMPPYESSEFTDTMANQLCALGAEKAALVYQLLRAMGPTGTTVVEAGSGHGISTAYLALAVAKNVERSTKNEVNGTHTGKVIATEYDPTKAAESHKNWEACGDGIADLIELRVGDLQETLKDLEPGSVDFVLIDIWAPLALPSLKIVQPSLRRGAVVVVDNPRKNGLVNYQELEPYVSDPANGFRRITLPFKGGLDFMIYDP